MIAISCEFDIMKENYQNVIKSQMFSRKILDMAPFSRKCCKTRTCRFLVSKEIKILKSLKVMAIILKEAERQLKLQTLTNTLSSAAVFEATGLSPIRTGLSRHISKYHQHTEQNVKSIIVTAGQDFCGLNFKAPLYNSFWFESVL